MPSDTILLQVENLSKTFRASKGLFSTSSEYLAVNNVCLQVRRGECMALVGESGSGKTTLSRCILRLLEPDQGRLLYKNHELLKLSDKQFRQLRPELQMIFQNPTEALNPRLSVRRTLTEPLKVWRVTDRNHLQSRVEELLGWVGLEAHLQNRFPNELSGGQRQRVAIARSLATNPEFVIADEPTSSLDACLKKQIVLLLKGLQKKLGLTMLLISHDLAMVASIANRIAVMYCGEIVEIAPTEQVLTQPRHPYTRLLLQSENYGSLTDNNLDDSSAVTVVHESEELVGCKFSDRCPEVQALCRTEPPVMVQNTNGDGFACHLGQDGKRDQLSSTGAPRVRTATEEIS